MKPITQLILALLIASTGCQRTGHEQQQASVEPISQLSEQAIDHDLIKTNCYACHNPEAKSHDVILAPPLAAVKFRYSRIYPDRESFVKAISTYLLNPQPAASLMPGAITKFGVMPASPLKEEQVREIAAYLYDNEPAQPVWFDEHFNAMHGKGGQ